MANLATTEAFDYILLSALAGFVAHFIAFETEFGIAIKRVVSVLATQDAVESATLVGTLLRHVPEFLAVATLDGWVGLDVVTRYLVLHLVKHVFLKHLLLVVGLRH